MSYTFLGNIPEQNYENREKNRELLEESIDDQLFIIENICRDIETTHNSLIEKCNQLESNTNDSRYKLLKSISRSLTFQCTSLNVDYRFRLNQIRELLQSMESAKEDLLSVLDSEFIPEPKDLKKYDLDYRDWYDFHYLSPEEEDDDDDNNNNNGSPSSASPNAQPVDNYDSGIIGIVDAPSEPIRFSFSHTHWPLVTANCYA